MFQSFTDRARRVVVLAQEEARLLGHNYIGTEHVLLGLVHEGEGVAYKTLDALDVSLDAVRVQVEEIVGRGSQCPTGHIPFTDRAKKALELSLRESLQLGHNYIGTEHILLGLIREGEGVAAQVLTNLGADLAVVRRKVIELLGGHVRVGVRSASQSVGSVHEATFDMGPVTDAVLTLRAATRRLSTEQWSEGHARARLNAAMAARAEAEAAVAEAGAELLKLIGDGV